MDIEQGRGKKIRVFPTTDEEQTYINGQIEAGMSSGDRYSFQGTDYAVVGLVQRRGSRASLGIELKPVKGSGSV